MDPSSTGECEHDQPIFEQPNVKGLPLAGASRNTSQEFSRVPITENTDGGTDVECGLQPSEAEFREQKAEELVGKTKEQRGWRKVIRNFTPS